MKDLANAVEHRSSQTIEEALRIIREKAASLRFGTITLTMHEGRLTQLEVNEKRRFAA